LALIYSRAYYFSVADMEVSELWERLQRSVEEVATSALTGKARKKHLLEKTAHLSGLELEKPKAPFRVLKGMREKAKLRAKRAEEEARVIDAVKVSKARPVALATKKQRKQASRLRK